jgi:sulfatase maturation enzyme AslB (radical SAM superfamily)
VVFGRNGITTNFQLICVNLRFNVGYDGFFRLCSSLWHPDTVYDLKKRTLKEAWEKFVPKVRDMRSGSKEFLQKCSIINLCLWCSAHAYLETGKMDAVVDYFCKVAHARAETLV